ncbi:Uncharacterised protein [Mycobacteroides abscessus subsp. abscessus]|nr:Uncharacterised protein [Mycobacteroides abscessus subsp. abscessus]
MPSCSTRSSRHFFSLPSAVPPGPVAMKLAFRGVPDREREHAA